MNNYFKMKQSAPDQSLYMKSGDAMIFIHPADIQVYKELLKLLDTKDSEIEQLNKQIEKLEYVVRVMEQALVKRGII